MLKHQLIQRLSCKVFHNVEEKVPGQSLDKLYQKIVLMVSIGYIFYPTYIFLIFGAE